MGKRKALDHVSFEVPEGEIFGFVGPNGAGKTTSGEDLPAWRAVLEREKAATLPVEATVTRLRERVSGARAARGPKPPPPSP